MIFYKKKVEKYIRGVLIFSAKFLTFLIPTRLERNIIKKFKKNDFLFKKLWNIDRVFWFSPQHFWNTSNSNEIGAK